MGARLIFVTGTDTGVGKTLLTGMLLQHLRQLGVRALAIKPFCSGGPADVRFLHALQDGDLTLEEINPYYFPEPVAPLVSASRRGRVIRLGEVVSKIRAISNESEVLLIEGSGGLLVPLGPGFSVLSLIEALRSEVVVCSANRLGTLNHTLLTVARLQTSMNEMVTVVLMDDHERAGARGLASIPGKKDLSRASNGRVLRALLGKKKPAVRVLEVPFLRRNPMKIAEVKKNSKKLKKVLATLLG